MTVEKLIEQVEWEKRKNREYKFSQHIKRKYMPYAEKCSLVSAIVKTTSYIKLGDKEIYKRDTNNMLFVFTMKLIERYTDIEWEPDKVVDSYDALMESGAMNALMSEIPQEEVNILRGMLDMERDDLECNTRSLISFFETKADAMQMMLGSIEDVLKRPEVQKKIHTFTKEV